MVYWALRCRRLSYVTTTVKASRLKTCPRSGLLLLMLICGLLNTKHCLAAAVGVSRCQSDNTGVEFALVFTENIAKSSVNHLQVYPAASTTSHCPATVDVKIQLPVNSSIGQWDQMIHVPTVAVPQLMSATDTASSTMSSAVIEVPSGVELNGTEQSRKAVVVTAAQPVGLYAMNLNDQGSCDGFVALPVTSFGTVYYAMCFYPTDYKSEIGIVAVEDGTVVNVTLKVDTRPGISIRWKGTTYSNTISSKNRFTIEMDRYDTVQLQDLSDLTGTLLESNRPIGVFSGNNFMVEGYEPPLVNPVHLVEQLPPVDDWGSTFYLVPMPGVPDGYTYRIMTSSGGCSVTIQSSDGSVVTRYLSDAGSFMTLTESDLMFVTIRSTEPVLVTQFAGGTMAADITGHRAMQLIPPAERFLSSYTFSTAQGDRLSNFTHYVLVVADKSAVDGLLIDGLPINHGAVNWTDFDASTSGNWSATGKVGGAIELQSGVHVIVQRNGVPFGAYVFGYSSSSRCIYAYPAGLCLGSFQSNNTISSTTSTPSVADCVMPDINGSTPSPAVKREKNWRHRGRRRTTCYRLRHRGRHGRVVIVTASR